jgi:uncharacterized protein with von Willebrand factor type A (vWA) domain
MKYSWVLAILAAAFLFVGPSPAFAQATGSGGGFSKQNLDLPFDAGGNQEEEEEAPEIVVFYGQQYEGDGIFFCCDRSGSMKDGTKFKKLQQEVIKNITQFSERVQFGIVFFDAGMVKFPNSGQPATATAALKAAGTAFVMTTMPGSGTCQKPALLQCLMYANQSSAKRKVIIYLSDGYATCGNVDTQAYWKETINEVSQRNTSRARVNCICIGQQGQVDETNMKSLAAQNGGTFARVVE